MEIIIHCVTPKGETFIHPMAHLDELQARLYLSFAYSETLGTVTYHHYDCWGVKRSWRA